MSEDDIDDMPGLGGTLGFSIDDGPKPTAKLDFRKYEPFFEGAGVSDEQKRQILEGLFLIGMEFYDKGFGLDLTGQACGKLGFSEDDSAPESRDMVSSEAVTLSEKFNYCAAV